MSYGCAGARGQEHVEQSARGRIHLLVVTAQLPGEDNKAQSSSDRLALWIEARRIPLLVMALAAALLVLGYRMFLAQPGEAAWAQCLWREVPRSAATWVAMDQPVAPLGQGGEPLPAELLKARLLGACAAPLAPMGSAFAEAPDWPALHSSLAAKRPPRVAEDVSDPRAFVCEVYFADDAALSNVAEHDWGHGDFNAGPIIGRRSSYRPGDHYGQKLSSANSVRFCRLIGPDGRPGRDRFQRAPLPDRAAG
jgi:hypothetical protein